MFPSKRALLVTAICALAGSLAEETSPSAAAQGPKATARPAQYDVVVRKNVMIRVKDGVGLAADLYQPAQGGQRGGRSVSRTSHPHSL
jgi:predicted acyl esterase